MWTSKPVRRMLQKLQYKRSWRTTLETSKFKALSSPLQSQKKEDLLWKSTLFQVKSGTLKFMLNASINTLPTPANLKRWKYTSSDICKLCGNRGTSNHYLICCEIMLDTHRYTWRHNNLINFIVNSVDKTKIWSYCLHLTRKWNSFSISKVLTPAGTLSLEQFGCLQYLSRASILTLW